MYVVKYPRKNFINIANFVPYPFGTRLFNSTKNPGTYIIRVDGPILAEKLAKEEIAKQLKQKEEQKKKVEELAKQKALAEKKAEEEPKHKALAKNKRQEI